MQVAKKKRYTIQDYISLNKGNSIIKNITSSSKLTHCMCGRFDGKSGLTCFKCNTLVHFCIQSKPNRDKLYQCASCINKALDPMFQVKKVYIDSFFRTENIFEYQNIINFEFYMNPDDHKFSVEVRGLRPGFTSLSWPMQGSFYLNDQSTPFYQIKPLLSNSNRKSRRQQYFQVPSERLKIGINYIRFRIYNLDKQRFTTKYQYQDKGLYYMSINSVIRLNPQDIVNLAFKQRRMEQKSSLALLSCGEVEITSNKVCLICPYTRDRIKVPIRGKYCRHFSCVCLQTLITSHMISRYWGCPICEQKISEPVVDMWIYQMLKDNQSGSDVLVNMNGTYNWIKNEKEDIMNLDDDDEEDTPIAQKTVQPKIVQEKPQPIIAPIIPEPNNKSKQIETIQILDDPTQKTTSEKIKPLSVLAAKLKQKMMEVAGKQKKERERESTQKQEKPLWAGRFEARQNEIKPVVIVDINLMTMNQISAEEMKKYYFRNKHGYSRKTHRYFNQNKQLKHLFTKIS